MKHASKKIPLKNFISRDAKGDVPPKRVIVYPEGEAPRKATLIGRNHESMLLREPGEDGIIPMSPNVMAILAP